ncbi:hypothetical protein PanWU01x14_220900, partial [Parasponia andersonii]
MGMNLLGSDGPNLEMKNPSAAEIKARPSSVFGTNSLLICALHGAWASNSVSTWASSIDNNLFWNESF